LKTADTREEVLSDEMLAHFGERAAMKIASFKKISTSLATAHI
jgi:hypothetical protein